MRFAWDDDQLALAGAVRDALSKGAGWVDLDVMGVLAVLVADAAGGLGLDECSLVPVLEETGRAAFAGPVVETAMVARPLGIADEVVTASVHGGPVPWSDDAGAVLLVDDRSVRVVRPVAATALETVDPGRPLSTVDTAAAELVTDDREVAELAFDRGALGTAAQLVGLAWAMLDLTVAYVVERRQFGVPVGSFQAVKHQLADARLAVEFAAPAVARAAWTTARGEPTRSRDVSMAKALATDAASVAGRAALQCHGAIGYTVEYELHRYLKRSWALSRAWGDRGFHADRVASAIGI